MDLTRTAYGTWNGGRYMHFGEPLSEERFVEVIQHAYKQGIRTFMTADVYGNGAADEMLGRALTGLPRESYCLIGAIGHDFYKGERAGSKGYPRFTATQTPAEYAGYVRMATEKALARCKTNKFDLLMLHNPDFIGYTSDKVWSAMDKVKDAGLTDRLGIAPGPANGFTLDMLIAFERFGPLLDWAMIILNPLEPWPGCMVLESAVKHDVNLITRVVDYGGLFHDDVKPGHQFGHHDHRTFRPAGWVEAGTAKMEQMREIARFHKLTMLQLACIWNLSQPAVKSVIPTLIQEHGDKAKSIESKVDELASLPDIKLNEDEIRHIAKIGNNKNCMELKGANRAHVGSALPDRWEITKDHELIASKWGIDPDKDIACTHKTEKVP
ncbi:aldo/keto reductase [Pedosphaera parvula]|uniref:Aldo/keto reductase n=1 Tax=Pedosphaera parvula (strain Ellin514) TaxID=320771 RepID=B9XI76_PEDPL|nr:aldo/keto reductase [Pedosphaera parvula]EEF60569.1 aldo/keto reductase [Pedosphaera parvula Ellin514]